MELLVCGGWLIFAFIGMAIGQGKNAAGTGFFLGLLFGPLGCLFAFLVDNRAQCPECRGRVAQGARICPSCRSPVAWYGSMLVTPEVARISRERDADWAARKAQASQERVEAVSSWLKDAGTVLHDGSRAVINGAILFPGAVARVIRRIVGEENALVATFLIALFWLLGAASLLGLGYAVVAARG